MNVIKLFSLTKISTAWQNWKWNLFNEQYLFDILFHHKMLTILFYTIIKQLVDIKY